MYPPPTASLAKPSPLCNRSAKRAWSSPGPRRDRLLRAWLFLPVLCCSPRNRQSRRYAKTFSGMRRPSWHHVQPPAARRGRPRALPLLPKVLRQPASAWMAWLSSPASGGRVRFPATYRPTGGDPSRPEVLKRPRLRPGPPVAVIPISASGSPVLPIFLKAHGKFAGPRGRG